MARVVDIEDAAALHSHAFQSKAEIDDIRSSLLVWYRASRRRLPWRGDGPIASKGSDSSTSGSSDGISTTTPVTPYGTWVSEIMLQQTRVDAVISHYNAWMAKFPTVEALAAADPEVFNTP